MLKDTHGYTAVEWLGPDLNLFSLETWTLFGLLQLGSRCLNFLGINFFLFFFITIDWSEDSSFLKTQFLEHVHDTNFLQKVIIHILIVMASAKWPWFNIELQGSDWGGFVKWLCGLDMLKSTLNIRWRSFITGYIFWGKW